MEIEDVFNEFNISNYRVIKKDMYFGHKCYEIRFRTQKDVEDVVLYYDCEYVEYNGTFMSFLNTLKEAIQKHQRANDNEE